MIGVGPACRVDVDFPYGTYGFHMDMGLLFPCVTNLILVRDPSVALLEYLFS